MDEIVIGQVWVPKDAPNDINRSIRILRLADLGDGLSYVGYRHRGTGLESRTSSAIIRRHYQLSTN